MGRVSGSGQHFSPAGPLESSSNCSLPAFVTLDSLHRPQHIIRNRAADLRGGYGPRSLAGSSPGRDNFSPRASAAALSTFEESKDKMPAPFSISEKQVRAFQMQPFPLAFNILLINEKLNKQQRANLNLFVFSLPLTETNHAKQIFPWLGEKVPISGLEKTQDAPFNQNGRV